MLELIRETLSRYEHVNHGCNHGAEYELLPLPAAPTLIEALELHFASQSTSLSPAQSASEWHLKLVALDHPAEELLGALNHWLVDSRPGDNDLSLDGLVDIPSLLSMFAASFDLADTSQVTVLPPLFYSCEWVDFALTGTDGFHLLHLGYSD